MSDSAFQNYPRCLANSTANFIKSVDSFNIYLLTFTCSFIGHFIISAFIIIFINNIRKKSNRKTLKEFKKKSRFRKNFKRSLDRSFSCPVFVKGFHTPENPSILDVKQLREIVNNDYIHQSENVIDYRYGGYMPITLGRTLGPNDKYKIVRKLGWGHFSTVWLCRNTEQTEEYYALKISKAAFPYTSVAFDEINILQSVKTQDEDHPGYDKIVMINEYFQEVSINGRHVCMSLEIMGPSLLDLIILSNYQGIEQIAAKNVIKQILLGLTYLHEVCHIIHTDIKPENILIKVTNSYIRNMVEYVKRFSELGVEMPKSYGKITCICLQVSASNWSDHIDLYDQATCSTFSTETAYPREKSCPGDKFTKKLQNSSNRQYHNGDAEGSPNPLFINPNIRVKIADLGNACWAHEHYAEVIQTVQYRALEVIINADYSFSADLWSVACVAFELCTGEYLFNPQCTTSLSMADDHLGLIWEVLDGIPKYVALSGRSSKKYFDSEGALIHIKPSNMKIWKVEDVLVDKYGWKRVDAIIFADFIQSLIEPDNELRATATVALAKDWLRETEDH